MKMIEARNLTFTYRKGDRPLIQNLSLTIHAGEMVAFLGPSGSGKSTLLYLLGGMLKPDHGEVLIEGKSLWQCSDLELALIRNEQLGFLFQQFHLLDRASVLENILLPARWPAETKSFDQKTLTRARALAQALGLEHRLGATRSELSGGEQQRTGLARALMNGASLILADEPTGNLDSKNVDRVLRLLQSINEQGKTVVLITHDPYVANHCKRIITLKDGEIVEDRSHTPPEVSKAEFGSGPQNLIPESTSGLQNGRFIRNLLRLSWQNLGRKKTRAFLTMLGTIIGIASVMTLMSLGDYSRKKILESYEAMGVNKILLRGYNNWRLKATDRVQTMFSSFDEKKDLAKMAEFFPEISAYSPILRSWNAEISFAGKSMSEAMPMGVNHHFTPIMNRAVIEGRSFSPLHVELRKAVCLIGTDIRDQLFTRTYPPVSPIDKVIHVKQGESQYACKVIGVLAPQKSNSPWNKPNSQILMPYTFFQAMGSRWEVEIHEVVLAFRPSINVAEMAPRVEEFYKQKYGRSGLFSMNSDDLMIAQMKKFLNIFNWLLVCVAFISLFVGGLGITNMMLVSLSERTKEIGLFKALGATHRSILWQFLLETLLLSLIAGIIGLGLGFMAQETLIYLAAKLVKDLQFEWIIHYPAILTSFLSIFVVGIVSGLMPGLRAKKLSVVEALRAD